MLILYTESVAENLRDASHYLGLLVRVKPAVRLPYTFSCHCKLCIRLFLFCVFTLSDDLADGNDYASPKREAEDRSMWRVRK